MGEEIVILTKEEIIHNLRNTILMKDVSSEFISEVIGLPLKEVRRIRAANTRKVYDNDPVHRERARELQRIAFAKKKLAKDKAILESGGTLPVIGRPRKEFFKDMFPEV